MNNTLMHTNQLLAIIDQERIRGMNEMSSFASLSNKVKTNKTFDNQQMSTSKPFRQKEEFDIPPPPYSEMAEISQSTQQNKTSSDGKLLQDLHQTTTLLAHQPPIMMELIMGNKLASKLQKRREKRRMERLDEVHDCWARLGLDTRAIMRTGDQPLPPFFWNPPKYDATEMNRRLAEFF